MDGENEVMKLSWVNCSIKSNPTLLPTALLTWNNQDEKSSLVTSSISFQISPQSQSQQQFRRSSRAISTNQQAKKEGIRPISISLSIFSKLLHQSSPNEQQQKQQKHFCRNKEKERLNLKLDDDDYYDLYLYLYFYFYYLQPISDS